MFFGNIRFIYEKKYLVSWKADGTRFTQIKTLFNYKKNIIMHILDT
jgi:hypothetical protein